MCERAREKERERDSKNLKIGKREEVCVRKCVRMCVCVCVCVIERERES